MLTIVWQSQICESTLEDFPVLLNRKTVLRTLQAELNFLDRGGYGSSMRTPWRSPYIFEESPSCPNFGNPTRPHECKDCWLVLFVPQELREEQVPCRFVQLTPEGVTVDSLYRYATQVETEEALRKWLQQRIHELSDELSEAARSPFAANG
jgi:hypothetical protein